MHIKRHRTNSICCQMQKQFLFQKNICFTPILFLIHNKQELLVVKTRCKMMTKGISQSISSFEEDFLKFVQQERHSDLKELLMKRLEELPEEKTTEITLVSFCLLDILLRLKSESESSDDAHMHDIDIKSVLQEKKVLTCLLPFKRKVHDLMSSLGDSENLLFFLRTIEDFDAMIDFLIKEKRSKEALNVLLDCKNKSLIHQLLIKHGYFLFKSHPQEMIIFISKQSSLEPLSILPSLLQGNNCKDMNLMKKIMLYLDDCVTKKKDSSIVNLLLTLYADFDEKKLMKALDSSSFSCFNFESIFVLDSCQRNQLKDHSVKILHQMGLHEDAVKEALDCNVSLAKDIAKKETLDERLKKKLWLKIISQSVSSGNLNDSLMKDMISSTAVSVTDILPLLPDLTTIDSLKKSICVCLQDNKDVLESLKEDMAEAAENVEEVKEDLKKWRKQSISIHAWSACSVCRLPVMSKTFLAFPCNHFFHQKCLKNQGDNQDCPVCGQEIIDEIQKPLQRSILDRDWS